MDYAARRRAVELGAGKSDLVVARRELDELYDRIYALEAAVEDVERDLAEAGDDPREIRRALDWLLESARPVLERRSRLRDNRR